MPEIRSKVRTWIQACVTLEASLNHSPLTACKVISLGLSAESKDAPFLFKLYSNSFPDSSLPRSSKYFTDYSFSASLWTLPSCPQSPIHFLNILCFPICLWPNVKKFPFWEEGKLQKCMRYIEAISTFLYKNT